MKGYRSAAHDLFCASSNFVVFDKPNRTNHKKLHKLTKLQNKRTIKTKILLRIKLNQLRFKHLFKCIVKRKTSNNHNKSQYKLKQQS